MSEQELNKTADGSCVYCGYLPGTVKLMYGKRYEMVCPKCNDEQLAVRCLEESGVGALDYYRCSNALSASQERVRELEEVLQKILALDPSIENDPYAIRVIMSARAALFKERKK